MKGNKKQRLLIKRIMAFFIIFALTIVNYIPPVIISARSEKLMTRTEVSGAKGTEMPADGEIKREEAEDSKDSEPIKKEETGSDIKKEHTPEEESDSGELELIQKEEDTEIIMAKTEDEEETIKTSPGAGTDDKNAKKQDEAPYSGETTPDEPSKTTASDKKMTEPDEESKKAQKNDSHKIKKPVKENKTPFISEFRIGEEGIYTKENEKWYAAYDAKSDNAHITFYIKVSLDTPCSVKIIGNDGEEITECKETETKGLYKANFNKTGVWTFTAEVSDSEGNVETLQSLPPVVISESQPELMVIYDGNPYKKDGEQGDNIYFNKEQQSVIIKLLDEMGIASGSEGGYAPSIMWEAPVTMKPGETITETSYKAEYALMKEGSYAFHLDYRAKNGRSLKVTEVFADEFRTAYGVDTYRSKTVVVDHTPPELTAFSFVEGTNRKISVEGGDCLYLDNVSNTESCILYTIEDENFSASSLQLYSGNEKKKFQTRIPDVIHEKQEYKTVFSISDWSGEPEGEYNLRFGKLADKAGNVCILGDSVKARLNSTRIIIDRTAPEMKITFPKTKYLSYDSKRLKNNGTELFYDDHKVIRMELKEKNFIPELSGEELRLMIGVKDTDEMASFEQDVPEEIIFKKGGKGDLWLYELSELPDRESHSYFTVSYTDFSGNPMKIVSDNMDCGVMMEEDSFVYISPVITVDKTAPVITTSFHGIPSCVSGNRQFFQKPQTMTVVVTDENFDCLTKKDVFFSVKYSAYDFDSGTEDLKNQYFEMDWKKGETWDRGVYEDGKKRYIATVVISDEWNYHIRTDASDLAGHSALAVTDDITVDNTKPYISVWDIENTPESDVTFHMADRAGNRVWFFDYKGFGYFHKDKIRVKITAHDTVSGIFKIKYVITHETGKVVRGVWAFKSQAGEQTRYITIPANEKAHISLMPVDFSQIAGEAADPRGVVSGTEAYHKKNSLLDIRINTKPKNTIGGIKYFNTSVNATITMKDSHAGIKAFTYSGGVAVSGSHNYALEVGSIDKKGEPEADITYTRTFNIKMSAGDNYTDRRHPCVISASFTDLAGHSSKAKEKLVIDSKRPVVTVKWSSETETVNQKYYRADRTAVITVKERNFDEKRVKWKINNMNGVRIGVWSKQGDINTCTVAFTQDGDDFLLDFDVTDMAGNSASCPHQETFTIDKTPPVISIVFDNNDVRNGRYYNKTRTATLHVQEHNFKASDVKYEMSAEFDGKKTNNPATGKWSAAGDHHSMSLCYRADGDYSLNFSYTDLAGNCAGKIVTQRFSIDQTKPVVKIIGVEDHTAYNNVIAPAVEYSDPNLDENSIQIYLSGNKAGQTEYEKKEPEKIHNGKRISWKDFQRISDVDDIYTLEVSVKDKAGNVNEPMRVIFSVNRFGSNYILGEATEKLVTSEHPHIKHPIPIEVTEVNVSGLKKKAVTVRNGNNEIITLKEGRDYGLTQRKNQYKWHEYTYVIRDSNFANEGQYSITISSVDAAANRMTNLTKEKQLAFVIDQTKPAGSISGLEEKSYRENQHDIYIRADDNYGLKEAILYVNGSVRRKYDAGDFSSGYSVTEILTGTNTIQKVSLKMTDWAGNSSTVLPDGNPYGSLITSDAFVQFYHNLPLFWGVILALTVIALGVISILTGGFGYKKCMAAQTGLWWFIFGKQRRER